MTAFLIGVIVFNVACLFVCALAYWMGRPAAIEREVTRREARRAGRVESAERQPQMETVTI